MSQTDWQQLGVPTVAKLQGYYNEARAAVADAPLADETVAGINTLLSNAARIIAALKADGSYGKGLIAGTVTPQKYADQANWAGYAIQEVFSTVNQENLLTRSWSEVVVPTAKEAKEVAAAAFAGGMSVLTLVVIGLIAVAVIRVGR